MPGQKKPISKSPAKQVRKTEGLKRRRKRVETFSIYIYKVLKRVHPETEVSKKAISIINSLIDDIFERIAVEGGKLVRYGKKRTLSFREV